MARGVELKVRRCRGGAHTPDVAGARGVLPRRSSRRRLRRLAEAEEECLRAGLDAFCQTHRGPDPHDERRHADDPGAQPESLVHVDGGEGALSPGTPAHGQDMTDDPRAATELPDEIGGGADGTQQTAEGCGPTPAAALEVQLSAPHSAQRHLRGAVRLREWARAWIGLPFDGRAIRDFDHCMEHGVPLRPRPETTRDGRWRLTGHGCGTSHRCGGVHIQAMALSAVGKVLSSKSGCGRWTWWCADAAVPCGGRRRCPWSGAGERRARSLRGSHIAPLGVRCPRNSVLSPIETRQVASAR